MQNQTLEDARRVQRELASRVSLIDALPSAISSVAGMDVSYMPFDPAQIIYGVSVRLSYPSLELLETAGASLKQTFPYVTGFLGFREAPVLIEAYRKLTVHPDLLFVDGHGVCHPRGLGIASHLGVLLDLPTIGVAKTILIGKPSQSLGEEMGSQAPLYWHGKIVGMLVRTKRRCAPLIISPGHKISFKRAVEEVLRCVKKHRLPEPTRLAHGAANECRRQEVL
jgi:deoxyribonuclease V